MKSLIIFYFTGTGNTEEVLGMLTRALNAENVKTDCMRIDCCTINNNTLDINGYDAIGIGYPVLAFNAPEMMEQFLKRLPAAEGKPAFIFKTSGEPFFTNNASSLGIDRLLKKRGYRLFYERHFIMPYNIGFRYPDEIVRQLYILAEKLSIKTARDLANDISCPPSYNPAAILISLLLRIEWPLARLNGRMYGVDRSCSRCQKCVKECRAGNIRLEDGRIKFGWKCMMCMRCVMYCPRGAVKAGLISGLALRGPYDFKQIMNNPAIREDAIQNCNKGFFKYFRKYIRKMEALTKGI